MRRELREAALREILRLLEIAARESDTVLKKEAMSHAVELSRSLRIKIPRDVGLLFCRRCLTPYSIKELSRVRVRRGRAGLVLVVTCGICGSVRRLPLRP